MKNNLPNFNNGYLPIGVIGSVGTKYNGTVPKIYGQWTSGWSGYYIPTVQTSGAISTNNITAYEMSSNLGSEHNQSFIAKFDASLCSSAYSRNDDRIVPNGYETLYIIKY